MNKMKEKLVNYLSFQVSQLEDCGLYHGKLGVILSLFCYGKVRGDRRLCDFATDMFQSPTHGYHEGDVGLENGLAGLGLGITLLYEAGMFHDDLNELLEEVDMKIMAIDPRRMTDHTFRSGACGILYYIRRRLSLDQECVTLHKEFIRELEENIRRDASLSAKCESFISSLEMPEWSIEEYLGHDAGLDNGSSFFLIQDYYDKIFSHQ